MEWPKARAPNSFLNPPFDLLVLILDQETILNAPIKKRPPERSLSNINMTS